MTVTKTHREEQMYRRYMTFFESAEKNRRWSPFEDLPWDKLEAQAAARRERGALTDADERLATCLETFCGVELFIPDYTKEGLNLSRDIFGQAWFQLCWGYEESKHALVFRQYLVRSGLRTEEEYRRYEDAVLSTTWTPPHLNYRQMACYGALQEIATYLIYQQQKQRYSDDPVLSRMFGFISRDEAAHTTFYRSYLDFEFEEDRLGVEEDLAYVITQFEMPGVKLVPNFFERLQTDGVGITSSDFMLRGIMPTLKRFGMDRRTLVRALARRKLNQAAGAKNTTRDGGHSQRQGALDGLSC